MQKAIGTLCAFLFLIVILPATAAAQETWARTYHGSPEQGGSSIQPTSDGGYVVAGYYHSGGVSNLDLWVLKLNAAGAIQWQKAYGGTVMEFSAEIIATSDGGYFLCGRTYSFGSGQSDALVLKLDGSGNIEWQRAYGGSQWDFAHAAQQTSDGGYIVGGETTSYGAGNLDGWVLKLSSSGSIQWQKAYGTGYTDTLSSIAQTPDGGYMVAGSTAVSASTYNAWVAKLDPSGNMSWDREYGSVANQKVVAIDLTTDGGLVAAVVDIDSATQTDDFVILKLDSDGDALWQYRFSGAGHDSPSDIVQTADGGYLIGGSTTSFGAGSSDIWALKLNSSGAVQWQKTLGDTSFDIGASFRQTSDGGFVVVGSTDLDLIVLKTDSAGELGPDCALPSSSFGAVAGSTFFVVGNASVTTATVTTVTSSTATTVVTTGESEEICGPVCTFCDDFDDGALALDWSYPKPAWSESNGNLVATPTRKAEAFASPAFAGCGSNCSFEAGLQSGGGSANTIWMLLWYGDKNNTLEVLMKEENDKFILKQRLGGTLVGKTKGLKTLLPNVTYNVRVTFDGSTFTLIVDGETLATMAAAGNPNGTIGFRVKNTTATFDHVRVD